MEIHWSNVMKKKKGENAEGPEKSTVTWEE